MTCECYDQTHAVKVSDLTLHSRDSSFCFYSSICFFLFYVFSFFLFFRGHKLLTKKILLNFTRFELFFKDLEVLEL